MPLYIKIIEFFDRDYHYRKIAKEVTSGYDSDEKKALALLDWTYASVMRVPEGFPLIDDHVLNIIIRGYGSKDQSCDVFATLCNYAGIPAFFTWVYSIDGKKRIPFSFAKLKGRWYIFDPYHGVYFQDAKSATMIDISAIKSGNDLIVKTKNNAVDINYYYIYLSNLPAFKNAGLSRSNIQSPLRRIIYEVKQWLKKIST
ncbi:MAG: transglutaminase domain-containing protein [Candidatus Omnitrophica bacterium]|nr:transglutaminase domain-containing protein [Candidatus Omnitrophota bacterium]